jgi:Leucine-rich repeat (LRR) protein
MRIRFAYIGLGTVLLLTSCAERKLANKVEKRYGVAYNRLCDTATALNLRDMGLRSIPNSVCRCSNLTYLEVSENDIAKLPKDIAKLTLLQELSANHTGLKTLPDSIVKLQNLKSISAIHSDIVMLPETIGEMKLEYLNLNGTPIRRLPNSIFKLYTLKRLYVGQQGGGSLIDRTQLDSVKLYLPKCDLYY